MTVRRRIALFVSVVLVGSAFAPGSSAHGSVPLPGGIVTAIPLGQTAGYAPPEAVIASGTQLQFTNLDLQQHDVVSVARDETYEHIFASRLVGFGNTVAVEGTEDLSPGAYAFYCSLHPNMLGTLHVVGSSETEPEPGFLTPGPHGPIGFGESVAYSVAAPCDDLEIRVVARTSDTEVAGPPSPGCSGVAVVPNEEELAAVGVAPHDVFEILLIASRNGAVIAEIPLRPKRLEAEHAEPVAGEFSIAEADDPFGGGSSLDVAWPGGTVLLGSVDLTEVSSIALRATSDGRNVCHPSYEGGFSTYCRAGTAIVTSGTPTGPVVTAIDIRGSDPGRTWIRSVSEPIRYHPSGPVELFVTFLPAVAAPGEVFARINYLELNGSGAAAPYVFPEDPPGTVTIFDGSSLDGWRMAGTGWFELEDNRSMRTVGGYGLLWYEAEAFADYTLRLEFKTNNPDANSGVFVRFPDPGGSALAPSDTGYEIQIQDYGQAYIGSSDTSQTGAIYSFQAADRVNTRTVGEWNTLEVRAVGQDYTVVLNGRVVNEFRGSRGLGGHIGVQNHDPYGTVWFRDIRVIPASAVSGVSEGGEG